MGNVTFKTPETLAEEKKAALLGQLENQRKDQEALGVTVNGIRYAGSPDNRAALGEALEFANAVAQTTFAGWKDSDGVFHADHPVAEVQQAYEAIGSRRSALIAKEGEYAAQITAGTLTDLDTLTWETAA